MVILKVLVRLILILALPLAVAFGTYWVFSKELMGPLDPNNTAMRIIEIAPGTSFSKIADNLEQQQFIKHAWSLTLLARFKKQDTKIKAGEYEFSPAMTPKEILAKLMAGDILLRIVTVREGVSIWDIGQLVQDAGVVSKEDFDKAVKNPELLAKAGIAAETFEGYLFPETYQFSRPISADQVVWRMNSEGEKHWLPEFQKRADSLRLSRHEILTLASIVEKESGNREEQPLVSSVFHNRINQGMKLQSDPTVIYGLKNFNGNLTKKDLLADHVYNTYVNFGLPPGPIANPGDTAISAALYPQDSTYLYFVGDNQGKHIFSTTLAEHNAAVLKYQKQGLGRDLVEDPEAVPPASKEMGSSSDSNSSAQGGLQ